MNGVRPSMHAPMRAATLQSAWIGALQCALFALLIEFIPWDSMSAWGFEDREVYFQKFSYLRSLFEENRITGFISFYLNEALWDLLARGAISDLGIPAELFFGLVTFLCLFCFARQMVLHHGAKVLWMLVNPIVIDFVLSQLRMAFAISILFAASWQRRRWAMLALAVLATFIHTAMFIFIGFYWLATLVSARLRDGRIGVMQARLVLLGGGIALALIIGPFREALMTAVGDRRAEYQLAARSLSYALFWMGLLAMMIHQAKDFFTKQDNAFAVLILTVFVAGTLLDVATLRFIAGAFPLLISAMLYFVRAERVLAIAVYVAYSCFQWYYWLNWFS
ncbi:MAG: hypothetical protein V4582_25235 [Pseudomonadota bacterium]